MVRFSVADVTFLTYLQHFFNYSEAGGREHNIGVDDMQSILSR